MTASLAIKFAQRRYNAPATREVSAVLVIIANGFWSKVGRKVGKNAVGKWSLELGIEGKQFLHHFGIHIVHLGSPSEHKACRMLERAQYHSNSAY